MDETTKLTLDNGEIIAFELSTADRGRTGRERLVAANSDPEAANAPFKSAIARVKPLANDLISVLTDLARQPDEVAVTFGLRVNAEAIVIIAKTATEAHFEVSLKWSGSN